ncbi:flagellar basal body protein [Paracoccus onubensis]|uniref:flagellar basal body protein n=1 Tax=Paracoccus onubensis TaxID=1675788 RepID=UPI002731D7BE|nr:flagellar basal body protein [Paracoccus onubensis]MDP0926805.1 flagellar basal body protein [Paracoccus onubensis]
MSLGNALLSAVSGLAVSSRGTEIVADNLANAKTPGFARREIHVSSRGQSGGVRIDGIARVVNTGLLAQQRHADAALNDSEIRLKFFQNMENVIGLPGTPGGLGSGPINWVAPTVAA